MLRRYDDIRGVWRQTFGSHSGWAQAILFAGELTRYRQLLHDHGCAPALGVAIKEERKEAAEMLASSPLKSKSPVKPEQTGAPSPQSKRAPKVKLELQPRCAAEASLAAATEAGPRADARVKVEFDADAAAPAARAATAPAKRVKRDGAS